MIVSSEAFGRLLLSIISLLGGLQKLAAVSGTISYMSSLGVPFPVHATSVAIVGEILSGTLTLVGYRARLADLIMGLWCIAIALVAHRNLSDLDQMLHLLKNIAMAGGFLRLVAFGAGAWSLDRWRLNRALQRA
jgi:putative oxidoreductase